ncbi:bis(5'-nucleosyl)-tetraphosphatase (symmetrical) YqeK [Lactovum miscens]|uniref:bis(5'-nucleosyl)-tetraphosphatase (symmetrical) n=1 Tax=Lactovum miscens TaxID=190387 RepID=A0A841C6Y2_9LACT|nr:bis(5'-nucleosyl)-tetraphosphatase (symmetrical) YqeK [Lactovum miscens]MBB5888563.1 putative HD superfamily hydrolase involved in NAD metabolism [Lactovum miscens]
MFDNYDEISMSRTELLEKIQTQVKPSRFKHMLGVEKMATELAERYMGNIYSASLAGLLHDYAKEASTKEFLRLIDKYQLDPDLKKWGNAVWHGKVGFLKVKEDLGLDNEEILHAIEVHTVGAKEMSLLDKIVYVADYIEEGRDFSGVDKARQLAKKSLDIAVAYETRETIIYLADHNLPIYPQTLETYNSYIGALTDKD